MHVLVTGGAGFIGSNLVDKLLRQKHTVTVWDNLSTGRVEHINPKAKFLKVDVSNRAIVKKALEKSKTKFSVIFHMAALARIQPSFENPVEVQYVNAMGTVNMLEIAREHKAKFIYPGSSTAYHDIFANPYSFSKFTGEQYCKLFNQVYGLSTVIARFFNVYGPRHIAEGKYATVIAIWERQKQNGEELTVTGNGSKRRDFTHVDDITDALIALSKQKWNAEIFNLGTGKNFALIDVVKIFKPKGIKFLPNRPGEAQETLADISETVRLLKWKPKKKLEDYIKNVI